MVARPGQCGGALAAKRVRTTWRIITWAAARVRFALAVARRRARSAENGLDLARCATCMFFFCFLFFGDRVRVHVAAHAGGGETDLATRGARCTQDVSCAHVFVSVCVCVRQLLCVVCLFAPRASRLLGRIVLAVHVLLGSRVCACLCFWFCVDAIFVFFFVCS